MDGRELGRIVRCFRGAYELDGVAFSLLLRFLSVLPCIEVSGGIFLWLDVLLEAYEGEKQQKDRVFAAGVCE